MFKGAGGGTICLELVPVVQVRDDGNDAGLAHGWGLQMKACVQMWVERAKSSTLTTLNLRGLLNI